MGAVEHLDREVAKGLCMVGTRSGNARRHHVAVPDRLDFLDLVAVDELVERCEEAVEQADHVASLEPAGERGEIDDVGEQDAGVVEVVRDRVGVCLQTLRDLLRENVREKRLDARLGRLSAAREDHEQHRDDERHCDDVEDVEGADETFGEVGALRPYDFGEGDDEQGGRNEGRKPRPRTARAVEGDCAERREEDDTTTELDASRPPSMMAPAAGAMRISRNWAVRRNAKLLLRAKTRRLMIEPATYAHGVSAAPFSSKSQ